VPDEFWEKFTPSDRSILFLDYDGTLAPFRVERDEAVPYDGVCDLLDGIAAAGSRLVIVSGREIEDVRKLLNVHNIEVWGSHGLKRRISDGTVKKYPLSGETVEQLDSASDWILSNFPAERCEIKYGCVAFHWRGMDRSMMEITQRQIVQMWLKLVTQELKLHDFDGGVELRANGRNKGDVVNIVLSEESDIVMTAYLGDDLTDEDAFMAIKEHGLGVLVRSEFRETEASIWLKPPEQLLEFLQKWRTVCGE